MAALVVLINWSVLNVTNLLRPLVHPFDFMTEAQPSMLSILQDIAFVLILLAAFRLTSPLSIGIKRFFFNLARGELGGVSASSLPASKTARDITGGRSPFPCSS